MRWQFFLGFGTILLSLLVIAVAFYFLVPAIFEGIVDALSKLSAALGQ